MFPYDLHCHSNHSDGDYPPARVIELAAEAGLKGTVLTDHNVTSQLVEATETAKKLGLWTCQGVEITSSYQGIDVHILAYSRRLDLEKLYALLKPIQNGYNERAQNIIQKLKKSVGLTLDFVSINNEKPAGVVFRYDIAKAIAQQGKYTLKEAQKLIGRQGPAWEPYGDWVPAPEEVVRGIKEAGGIAVLGHPGDMKRGASSANQLKSVIEKLVARLIEVNLDGLEIRHSSHEPKVEKFLRQLTLKQDLLITGGSDWHGEVHHPEITLGMAGLNQQEFERFRSYLRK